MSATEMQRGVLRLFVLTVPDASSPDGPDAYAFGGVGGPESFALRSSLIIDDVEFGDGECKELPDWRHLAGGLWVLEWAWEQVEDEDGGQFFDCRYVDSGTWRRLTDVELQALANGTLDSLVSEVSE